MPGMDRTGPLGNGPIGRRMGPCFGGQGGRGRGYGFNRGNRLGWNSGLSYLTPEEDGVNLEHQRERLESELMAINKLIQEQKGSE